MTKGTAKATTLRTVVVTVPTWNEALNVEPLVSAILTLNGESSPYAYEVLVADDDSPDGTWKLVARQSELDTRVHLMHRTTDRGRGRAGRDAFLKALDMGADAVIEMDADFSHPPRYIPEMVAKLDAGYDVVLGSRAVAGGKDIGRSWTRRGVTRLANFYIRVLLGLTVRDCNSGYRAWRASALRTVRVEETASKGPAIVQELLYKAARARLAICEIPIEFVERERGESSLTFRKLLQGYWMVLRLRWWTLTGRIGRRR